jgi:hypothetical protein
MFRGGKQWKFDNKPKPNKPFGELIDGGKPAKINWPGIHFPGGTGSLNRKFIIIYRKKWSLWVKEKTESDYIPSEGDLKDQLIGEPEEEEESEGDVRDSGALIPVDDQIGKYAKIKNENVCYLTIGLNNAYWMGNCVPVKEDKNQFPPNIIGAILTKDHNWYYFNKEGKYCKRPERTTNEVKSYLLKIFQFFIVFLSLNSELISIP